MKLLFLFVVIVITLEWLVYENLKLIILLPLVIFSLLMLIVSDLFRKLQGRPTLNEEWHEINMDGNANHGQGRKK